MTDLILQALFSGVLIGSVYALVALGLALAFGAMRIINLAHGELVLLAAYMAYFVEASTGLNPYAAIPLALLAVLLVSWILVLLVSWIREHRELNSLILTFAMGIILTNGILLVFASDVRTTNSATLQDAVSFGDLFAMRGEIVAFFVSLVLMGFLWWWLKSSWYGRAMRAVSSNRDAARLMGINPARIETASFLVAGALAAFAGVALYTMSVIQPATGHALTVKAFIITVLAGVGSIPGVFLGALLLGVTEALTVTLASSALQELAGMVLFLLVLFLLPNGLFGARARRG
ncbi:Branched-chain amino acid transport system permease protein livH (plasmid) [Roseomonas mucosa]|jgi:branched-chain amino acid transport system permease protein|uniref:Branched-chain amino acid ABC transporter permease n=1 Tax=Roseomonas mucosa TaxID=207340 RepID=A0A1S8D550_9PROT|nr:MULTISPECIES: branched-chain amino acid ABC transporter permease [Roseomonas]MBS5904390.1 branched-chain amino acid ABC transporter permease [Acetobacteraceae bacterium]ATR19015.1 branched-chain amino acid ABC transporter permease [Roseomonas sp. FDAARGOS_362]AWV20702.1 Branched-chain amino acid transport system permease protein livH [Roseomonas mucosa]MCG7351235.1 branched-chain amino acid ABC transporter permease [Roseomonas mucosa]MCG7356673.1 branched-chain amino acid ABC transporter pe